MTKCITFSTCATAANTASLLFQTGFSSRAEIGLAGSDDVSIKVSPDGSAWLDAIMVNRATGKVSGEAAQTSATDVTTGRLLRVGAFGLGSGAGPNVTDLDAHEISGFFFGYGGASTTPPTGDNPFPTLNGAYGLICGNGVLGDAGSYLWQIAVQYGTLSPKLKFRNKAGTTWDAWQTVVATDNILGPVSQTDGVPAGAVIERGSNANGDYVRFADAAPRKPWRAQTATRSSTSNRGWTRSWSRASARGSSSSAAPAPLRLRATRN